MIKLLLAAAVIAPLAAGPGTGTGTGQSGQKLTVSQVEGLKDNGQVTVTGSGYDEKKGIYVSFCKDNGPGKTPTPCGGGADTTGTGGGSQWVSSNPPPYGKELTIPYGAGGTFSVKLNVKAKISDTVDCAKTKCAIITRADHTRAGDRTLDVRVPVTFDDSSGIGVLPIAAGVAGLAVVGGVLGFVIIRRRAS